MTWDEHVPSTSLALYRQDTAWGDNEAQATPSREESLQWGLCESREVVKERAQLRTEAIRKLSLQRVLSPPFTYSGFLFLGREQFLFFN